MQDAQPTETQEQPSEQSKPSAQKVEFDTPPGFTVPESASQSGGEFDAVSTYKVEGGKLCLVKIGETPMPGYDGKESQEEKPAPPSYDQTIGRLTGNGQEGQ